MPTTNESEPQDEAIRMSRDSRRAEPARRRVLLKLSGEVFGGGSVGVDTTVVRQIAEQIAATVGQVETSIVVGGGNFFRGAELSQAGMDRSRADYMGMLGTVMNLSLIHI